MKELLASYYGMQQQERSGADKSSDVESTYFEAKRYVAGLLKNDKVETLLRKDDEMVREVKKLDSDMQMLVYENYNKFISATDTIRKMAQNVEGMETEMSDLKSSMERIAESSATVNTSLEGNRSKMDKLVRVRRLLQRLDFLFQLPQRLEEAVQEGQYAKAIRYFSMTKDILHKHSHVSSFGAIQRDCEDTLRSFVSNAPRLSLSLCLDLYLLSLSVLPFSSSLSLCLDLYLCSISRSVCLPACLSVYLYLCPSLSIRTVQLYDQLFEQTGASPTPSASSTPAPPTAAQAPPETKQQGQQKEDDTATTAVANGQDKKTHAGLIALVQASVGRFFDLLYTKVGQSLDANSSNPQPRSHAPSEAGAGAAGKKSEGQQQGGGGEGTAAEGGGGGDLDPVALGGVVAAVQQLVTDIETVDPHVPQVQLARRAREFAQEFKRGQVRRAFRVLCRTSLSVTTSMVNAVRGGTPPEDILADAIDTEYPGAAGGGMTGGSGRHGGSSSVSGGGRNRRAGGAGEGGRYPALVDRALGTLMKARQTDRQTRLIRLRADEIVSGLRPLSRLDSSPGPLAEELRFGLWGVVLWLASALGIVAGVTGGASSCDSLPPAEGREYNKALEEEWGNRAVSALREPLPSPSPSPSPDTKAAAAAAAGTAAAEEEAAVSGDEVRAGASEGEVSLLLACLCRSLETTFVVRVPEILGRQIPLTLDQSVHAPPPSMHFTGSIHSTRSVTSTLKSAATEKSMEGDDDAAGGGGGGRGGPMLGRRRQLDAVRNRVSAAARFILEYYAETTGRRLADVLQVGLEAPPGGAGDWFSVEEPTGVGEAVLDALELAEDNVKEVCAFLGEARSGTVSVTRSGDRDLRRGSSVALLSGTGRNGRGGMGGGGGVRRDIDRIFESSGAGGGMGARGPLGGAVNVSFAADAMLAAVFRVALKAFGERARFLTLPGPAFRQVQLDADFLRQALPFYVAESNMLSALDNLLDQALQSAADRSLDPTPMDPAAAGEIVAHALDGFN
ncbi:unnamed protein product [Ectocarpus sp. 8 AP-2014]